MTHTGQAPDREDVMNADHGKWVREMAIKRQMDFGSTNGCQVTVKAAGAFGSSVEYHDYESNKRLAWARLVRGEKFRSWILATKDSEFIISAQLCANCGVNMTRGIEYNSEWAITLCSGCSHVAWFKVGPGKDNLPPFVLAGADFMGGVQKIPEPEKVSPFDVPGGEAIEYSPEKTIADIKRKMDADPACDTHEDGRLEGKDFVSVITLLAEFIEWAGTSMRQKDLGKTQEILDGLDVALSAFLQDPDGAAVGSLHIPIGSALKRIKRDKKGAPKKGESVRWEMSLAHMRNCLDRHTAALNVLKGLLGPVMKANRSPQIATVEIAKQLARLERVFNGDPDRTVGNLAFPTATVEPSTEVVWGMSRLGMLVHQTKTPVEKMRIGEYIQYKRVSCGLSAREVARDTKMPPDRYRRIENGDTPPSKGDVSRIVQVIRGADLSFALGRHGIKL